MNAFRTQMAGSGAAGAQSEVLRRALLESLLQGEVRCAWEPGHALRNVLEPRPTMHGQGDVQCAVGATSQFHSLVRPENQVLIRMLLQHVLPQGAAGGAGGLAGALLAGFAGAGADAHGAHDDALARSASFDK